MKNIKYKKILSSDSSFQLVRTNPKLTGNIKLTVNENGEVWLDSIKANLELAKDDYSRFPIDYTQSLASNIHRFFKNGETPNNIIFALSENVDVTKTSNNFKDQFDFSNYFSGIKYFPSNKYEERFSYFAPLYLKKELPEYFIIFKITDPLNNPIDISKANFESGQSKSDYLIELFKKATIIKTFNLSEETNIGKLIRSFVNNSNFPISPLTVSFKENEQTTWNGIVIDSGILGSRGEFMYNQYSQSTPLKAFEENITQGYERNGVIFPNILNLDFIFNDETSNNYEINRYLGIYVNSIELSEFDIDLKRAYYERSIWPNSEKLKREYSNFEETTLVQSNTSGVIIPYLNMDINISEFNEIFSDEESLYFNYIKDKNGKLFLPKLNTPYSVDYSSTLLIDLTSNGTTISAISSSAHNYLTDDYVTVNSSNLQYSGSFFITKISDTEFTYVVDTIPTLGVATGNSSIELNSGKIKLSNTKIELADFFGPSNNIFLQDKGNYSNDKAYSFTYLKILGELNHIDEIKLYFPNGTRSDSNGKYELLTGTSNYSLVPNSGDSYSYYDYSNTTGNDVFYFNSTGSPSEIIKALVKTINSIRNKTFFAYSYNDTIIIKCTASGDFDNIHKIQFSSTLNQYSNIEIDYTSGTQLIGNIINYKGGSKPVGNRLIINRDHFDKISNDINNILIKTKNGWSKIKKISNFVNVVDGELTQDSLNLFFNKISLVLEKEETPTITYGDFIMRKKYRPEFGVLSLFPIKDLDFDFYNSTYSNFPIIDLYQNYYIPENINLLEPGNTYKVINGNISVSSITNTIFNPGDTFTVTELSSYKIEGGEPIVSFDNINLITPIYDENGELNNFTGFSILKDPEKVIPNSNTELFNLKLKYLNGLTTSEYDFYKENESLDFSTRSKIIPYITKWGIKNGFDSRENPYRLNAELVFGKNNFSPDHTSRLQNPINFTHEWFYIESNFNYVNSIETIKQNNYYFDKPLDIQKMINDPNYFIEYFTYTPSYGQNLFGEPLDVSSTQFRYSSIFKNSAGQYETLFKGFKIIFNDINNPNVLGGDGKPLSKQSTNRFDEYKFSCILKPVKEDFTDKSIPPISYKFIEHSDYKFIVLVIQIAVGSLDSIDQYWYNNQLSGLPTSIGNDPTSSNGEVFYADPTNSSIFGSYLPFETINGDYRITFNSDEVSNISHSLLYSLKNKKFNSLLNNFSNVNLSSKINLTSFPLSKIDNLLIPEYPSLLSDEIILPKDNTLISIVNDSTGQILFLDSSIGSTPRNINPITKAADEVLISDQVTHILSIPSLSFPYTTFGYNMPLNNTIFLPIINQYFNYSVISGGEQYFEKLLEKISFTKFKKYVNDADPIIQYEQYYIDNNGITQSVQSPNYYLQILEPNEISKSTQIINNIDESRPTQFSNTPIIGYTFERAKLNVPLYLNRYDGEYEPITNDLLYCKSNFIFNKNKINDLKLSNIKLNSYIDDLLTIKNFNHIKVADSKILELESDSAYFPNYPKIFETAIGKAKYNLINSNWDWGFHLKYKNKEEFEPVAGSIRVEEDEGFLSKIVILPNEIELDYFSLVQLSTNEKLENIDLSQVEIVAKENNNTVDGFINLENAIISYLLNSGIEQKFNEFLINSPEYIGNFDSIKSYVIEYIKLNILKLYEVSLVEIYSKKNATLSSTEKVNNINSIEFTFINDLQRETLGYSVFKSVKINKTNRLLLNFSIRKEVNSGISISPKIKIKFI
jgi:hypothetical protein